MSAAPDCFRCHHARDWHDDDGARCHAYTGLEFEYDCDCAGYDPGPGWEAAA